ncbi:hypothetical protein JY742_10190 [Clostridioides difficile]|nr:hypothetical protein [Clostridioides difficile]
MKTIIDIIKKSNIKKTSKLNFERNILIELEYCKLIEEIERGCLSEEIRGYCQLTIGCTSIELNVFTGLNNEIDAHYAICLNDNNFEWRTEYLSNTINILNFKNIDSLFKDMERFLLEYLTKNNLISLIR